MEQGLRLVSSLFVGVWVARYLGPEQFGIFNYAIAFTALFAGIAKLGLDGIVVRELVKQQEKCDELLGTVFWLKAIGAIITVAILFFASILSSNNSTTHIYILIIAGGILFQSFEIIDFYFQSKVLVKYVSICKLIQLSLSSLVKIYFVLAGKKLIWFVGISLLDSMTIAGSLWFAYVHLKNESFIRKFSSRIAKKLLADSWPVILSGIAITVYVKIDQIMINSMLGPKEVGQYSAGIRLSEVWNFIPMIICSSLFPAIINSKKQSEELYYQRLQKLYNMVVLMALTIALTMTFMSDWIINFLYGEQYIQAAGVLKIHVWAGISVFMGVASWNWLVAENLQFYSTLNTAIGAAVNIIMNYLLLKKYGVEGAAWATVASYTISGYLMLLVFKKTRKNFFKLTRSLLLIDYLKRGLNGI